MKYKKAFEGIKCRKRGKNICTLFYLVVPFTLIDKGLGQYPMSEYLFFISILSQPPLVNAMERCNVEYAD